MQFDLAPAFVLLRQQIPSLAGTYLFGSQAGGSARADSDVDLAVFAGQPLPREQVVELAHELGALLRRDVDLVDLASAPTIMQFQIIAEGRLVDAREPDASALFELRVMREYQDLKERRAAIEADIVERGRVYGR
jgi:predicted nucleotidyltransferase